MFKQAYVLSPLHLALFATLPIWTRRFATRRSSDLSHETHVTHAAHPMNLARKGRHSFAAGWLSLACCFILCLPGRTTAEGADTAWIYGSLMKLRLRQDKAFCLDNIFTSGRSLGMCFVKRLILIEHACAIIRTGVAEVTFSLRAVPRCHHFGEHRTHSVRSLQTKLDGENTSNTRRLSVYWPWWCKTCLNEYKAGVEWIM